MEKKYQKRMIEVIGYKSEDKTFKRWKEIGNPRRILKNYLIMVLCRILPDIEIKHRIYRKTGMKIGKHVSLLGASFDIFFPQLIEIGDNCIIGNHVTILTHEFLVKEWRKGPVKVGKGVTIGGMTLVLPGVTIGDGAVIAAYSLVNKDVEPGAFVGGVPIKELKRSKRK